MLLGRLVILVLIGYAVGHDALPAPGRETTDHHTPAVLGTPAQHPQPAENSDVPIPQEEDEDLLQSLSDCTGTSASAGASPLVLAPSTRASSLERPLSLSRPTQRLYSLRRLRI
jgi:hypothetical protein